MFLTGEFADPRSAEAAVEALRANGFEADEIEVFSGEPLDLPAGLLDRPSLMSLGAVAGAVGLCLLAAVFVAYTQYDFPIVTGGMPVFSMWATGVIFYEFTMLGAIASTFLMFLWESGVLRRNHTGPVPALAANSIYLRVHCEPDEVAPAGECLYGAGAASVKRQEDPA